MVHSDPPGGDGIEPVHLRLKRAADLVEDCAFQAAEEAHADVVAELILMSVELTRLVKQLTPPDNTD